MSQQFSIGTAYIDVPHGWRQVPGPDGDLIVRSPDDRQQVTLNVAQLENPATFDDFKRICAVRLKAEKQQLVDGGIEPNPVPFQQNDLFGFVYTGVDRKTRRMFSTYLSLETRELVTLYLESFAVQPNRHIETFKTLIANLKRDRK